MQSVADTKISYLPESLLAAYPLPERFTFPFYYEPHPLTVFAAEELQQYLSDEAALDHNFGIDESQEGMPIGKMFGVLIVLDAAGKPGYLSAFSGKLAHSNQHTRFVPPVFDMLTQGSFFLKGQEQINELNSEIARLEQDPRLLELTARIADEEENSIRYISELKAKQKVRKQLRDQKRQQGLAAEEELIGESLFDKRQLRELTAQRQLLVGTLKEEFSVFEQRLNSLKADRRNRSAALQDRLFEQYSFLDQYGRSKSLQEIFSETAYGKPPSAAGECATPKLLQYAFQHAYKPLAMAEFWWGASPKSEIRKHGQFYPACTGKCKPILAHMLADIPVEENPLQRLYAGRQALDRVYEDDQIVLINKPHGLRSVPGVDIKDSVATRLKIELDGREPLVVHRLDMDTSGLLLFAKTPEAHRHLQKQFLKKTIRKCYEALLDGHPAGDGGRIDLPLTPDPFDRPRQIVCAETGKPSVSDWKVLERSESFTRVLFYPHTGRTHQLRVHAAHPLGLGTPIKGDDLYGRSDERLFLHAKALTFKHPLSKVLMDFEIPTPF